jgi:hypothetical protein
MEDGLTIALHLVEPFGGMFSKHFRMLARRGHIAMPFASGEQQHIIAISRLPWSLLSLHVRTERKYGLFLFGDILCCYRNRSALDWVGALPSCQ